MTTVKAGSVPETMGLTGPNLLQPGDTWTHTCELCSGYIQGGMPGLYAHVATVHPEGAA